MTKLRNNLKKIESKIAGKNTEFSGAISTKGKIMGFQKGGKTNVDSVNVKYYNTTIGIHNHPKKYVGNIRFGLAPSDQDLYEIFSKNYAGARVVETYYTHVIIPTVIYKGNKNNLREMIYNEYKNVTETVAREWKNKVNDGKMTLKYYYNNCESESIRRLSKKLGFEYFIKKNGKENGNLYKYQIEVIPPKDLPKWLSKAIREKYIKKWNTAVEKYPELKLLKGKIVKDSL